MSIRSECFEGGDIVNKLTALAAIGFCALTLAKPEPVMAAAPEQNNFNYYQKDIKHLGDRLIAGLEVTASTDHDPSTTGGESIIFPRSTGTFGIVRKSLMAASRTYKPFLNNTGTALEWGFKKTPAVLSVEFLIPRGYQGKTFCIEGSARLLDQTSLVEGEICWDIPR